MGPLISRKSRLVKYYNLGRWFPQKEFDFLFLSPGGLEGNIRMIGEGIVSSQQNLLWLKSRAILEIINTCLSLMYVFVSE